MITSFSLKHGKHNGEKRHIYCFISFGAQNGYYRIISFPAAHSSGYCHALGDKRVGSSKRPEPLFNMAQQRMRNDHKSQIE